MYKTGSYQRPKSKKIGPIIFTLGAIAVAGFVGLYVSQLIEGAQPTTQQAIIKVLVAANDIPLGKAITAADIKLIDWPVENAPYRAASSIDEVVGRVALRPLVKGESISDQRLAPIEAGQGLGALIPRGMRAQSLKINGESGVAGFIKPGDFVDMVIILREEQGVTSRTSLQNIQVLAVGEQYQRGDGQDKQDKQAKKAPIVTVLLRPDQAEHLAVASTNGEVVLTLRNGYDTEEITTSGFSGANIDISPAEPRSEPAPTSSNTSKPDKVASNTRTNKTPKPTELEKTITETKPEDPQMPQVIIGGKIVSDTKNNKNKIVIVPMPKS